ncbi:MAK10-like protein [Tanacetum coccineum]
MGDENPIRTLGDYSKPSNEGYRNTIELPVGKNVVPLRSNTIRLVQNGCSFHRLRSEDPNQHLKDFLKLVDSLDLAGENKERTCLDHESWNDTKELVNPVKAISTPQGISKTPDRRLLELEDQINFLLKGSRPTLRSSTYIPHAYADAELMTSRTPEKVLIREEAKVPVTKNVNSISLAKGKEERSDKMDEVLDNTIKPIVTETEISVKEDKRNSETKIKPVKRAKKKEVEELLSSRPVEYYLKHKINEKLIEGLVDNNRFNDSLSKARVRKVKGKTCNVLPRGIGGLKHVNTLIDQGFNVNVMPYTTYMKLMDERPAETDIRLSLASHLYIYLLGIAEDVLVEFAEHVYPIDFVILDIKENEKRPFILGTPFLTTAKATIKFDKGTITLRSGKSKASPRIGRKDKDSLGKGDGVQPMEEQKFQRQASHSYCNQGRNGR